MSCERVVRTEDLLQEGSFHTLRINRMMTDGVIEAPLGAHPTSCEPDYGRDDAFLQAYAQSAADERAWADFSGRYLGLESHDGYRRAIEKSREKESPR